MSLKDHTAKASAFSGKWCTHTVRRDDAVIHNGREMVPTIYGTDTDQDTKYIDTIAAFKSNGVMTFNEDHTEVWLTLPEGFKFSCQFALGGDYQALTDQVASLRIALRDCVRLLKETTHAYDNLESIGSLSIVDMKMRISEAEVLLR